MSPSSSAGTTRYRTQRLVPVTRFDPGATVRFVEALPLPAPRVAPTPPTPTSPVRNGAPRTPVPAADLVDLGRDGAGVREVLLARPPRGIRATLWVTLLLLALALAWSCVATVEVVVTAEGVVRPRGEVLRVEATAGGQLSELLVSEGAAVASGQLLARLDQRALLVELQRARALLEGQRRELAEANVGRARLSDAHAAARATREAELRQAELLVVLEEARCARTAREGQARLATAEAALMATSRRAQLQEERVGVARQRVEQGILARDAWEQERRALLELQAELVVRQAELEAAQVAAEPDRRALETAASQVELRTRELRTLAANQALEVSQAEARAGRLEAELAGGEQDLRALELRLAGSELRAPCAGVVSRLAARAAGRVLSPGDAICEVAPAGVGLVLEALAAQNDRGELEVGRAALLRFAAFPVQDWGPVASRVERIGADAESPGEGQATGFRVTLPLDQRTLTSRHGGSGTIELGMTAQADIVVGERRVIATLVSAARELLEVRGR